MKGWTIIHSKEPIVVGNNIKFFESKKKCDAYIKNTFPKFMLKMTNIKSLEVTINPHLADT